MRLGILGPAQGDLPALARAAQHLLYEAHVDKAIYLSDDDGLDAVVAGLARKLIGAESEEGLFNRAAVRCARGSHRDIDEFVASARAHQRLRLLFSLPKGPGRTIELLDGKVVLFVYDKATLDEEDIAAARILVFGKSPKSIIKKVGARTFISPGPVGSESGGRALLDDRAGGVRIEILNSSGAVTARDFVAGTHAAVKFRVQGGSSEG